MLRTYLSGRNVRRALLAVLVVYLLVSLFNWYLAVNTYGLVGVSDDEDAVRYALGSPASVDEAGRTWTYKSETGAITKVKFSEGGRLARISCASKTAEPNSCPELYGIGIGDTEDAIGGNLGGPSYERIEGDRKYVTYAGLGATYVLQQFVVTGLIRDPDQGSFGGKTWKFFRNLVYLPGQIG